ncbi:hypothetical protein FRX31_025689, partial [Thalictrum thalictroides]
MGDNNTAYFFNSVKERRMRNKISCLRDDYGNVITDLEQIGAKCAQYYEGIYNPEEMQPIDVSMFESIQADRTITNEVRGSL